MIDKKLIFRWSRLALVAILLGSSILACTGKSLLNAKLFKERAAETPAPSDTIVDKSFFREADGKPKRFLCGWAPEMTRGLYQDEMTLLHAEAPHCNIEFDIEENYLIGRIVNPSFPTDVTRWDEFIKIRINAHFYYEQQLDENGRKTNVWIKNERSHWKARPTIELNLSDVQLGDIFWGQAVSISAVRDIDWGDTKTAKKGNFLGFTLSLQVPSIDEGDPRNIQADYRVNFLQFDHDADFDKNQKVPYHQENSRYFNILHVMGRKIKGITPELYAAHWDFSKGPVKLHLVDVPERHHKTILNVVEKWNQAFRDLGVVPANNGKAFDPVFSKPKHRFDLRYTSLVWIDDERLSLKSALGIGMAHADVTNGKILWGTVVIWGGMLERYINAYAPIESGSGSAMSKAAAFPLAEGDFKIPERFDLAPAFQAFDKAVDPSSRLALEKTLQTTNLSFSQDQIVKLQQQLTQLSDKAKNPTDNSQSIQDQISGLQTQLQNLQAPVQDKRDAGITGIVADMITEAQRETKETKMYFDQKSILENMGYEPSVKKDLLENFAAADRPALKEIMAKKNQQERNDELRSFLPSRASAVFSEFDRTVDRMEGGWNASPAQKTRTYPQMLESVVTELVIHELGHVLGLGHQFKENIVPKSGTVPSKYVKAAAEKATADKHFMNYTSVMGYKNGRVEVLEEAKNIKPGPHDLLVLRYLYKGVYSTYDAKKDEFRFFKVPVGGKIPALTQVKGNKPSEATELPVSYFPACNDFEASFGADPFCNRWDYGSRAQDIVRSYFANISDNLTANLFSLVGSRSDLSLAQYKLWYRVLDNFSRVRLFYDEMRRRMRSDVALKPLWNELRADEKALFEFSQACQESNASDMHPTLKKIFEHEDIKDLCVANGIVLNEFKFFLNLPEGDFNRIDHSNRYISGGYLAGDAEREFGQMFGSWYQMSNLPLKQTALYALTTTHPWVVLPSPFRWFVNPFYRYEEDLNLYRTLYPREYTKLVADAVKYNLQFASSGRDDTTVMGQTVFSAGWMVPVQRYYTNDSAKLPRSYNETLNQQTQFQVSMVAVLINAVPPETGSGVEPDHYKKFTASVYDFYADRSVNARDIYILRNGNVFVRANGMFIYPITKIKFYNDTSAYVIAYKVSYDFEVGDPLLEDSVKFALNELHDQIANTCVEGFQSSGLMNWFDSGNEEFKGFHIPTKMPEEAGKEKLGQFLDSIKTEWDKYEAAQLSKIPKGMPSTMTGVCDESLRGIGLIAGAGAVLNGQWLSILAEMMVKR